MNVMKRAKYFVTADGNAFDVKHCYIEVVDACDEPIFSFDLQHLLKWATDKGNLDEVDTEQERHRADAKAEQERHRAEAN
jgi:hypothetical protein